jgi:hypothetical protein
MQRKLCDHRPAVTTRLVQPDITRRRDDYALGYADRQAERRR